MLGWEVEESQQFVTILYQAFDGPWVFRLEGFDEQVEGGMRILSRLGLLDVMQHFLCLGLGALRQVIQHIARFVHPAALLARANGRELR